MCRLTLSRIAVALPLALAGSLLAGRLPAAAAPCYTNPLYSVSATNTNVYAIDPQNGFATTLVGTDSFISAAAARRAQDGKIYYISRNTPLQLGSFDPATGTNGTPINITGTAAADTIFVRAGFTQAGVLYAQTLDTATLYSIDTTSGVATNLGTVANQPVSSGDLAFDIQNQGQYYTNVATAAGGQDLYRVTLSPLAATRVGALGIATGTLFGIAYGNDGKLYAIDNAGPLYVINVASGAATQVASPPIAGGANDLASLPIPITTDLGIVKTHATNPVYPGQPISYALTVTNSAAAGNCSVQSLTVADSLPASLSAPTYTASTGSYNVGSALWTGLNLGPGQSITLNITATVAATATGTIANTATVSGPAGIPDANPANNTSTDNATVTPLANLSIAKSGSARSSPGGLINYAVRVSNAGPDAANNATFTDPLPAGVMLTGTPTCSTTSGSAACGTVSYDATTRTVSSTIPTLAVGGVVTFSFTATAASANTYTNTATVAPPRGTGDMQPATSSLTTTVAQSNGVSKTVANLTQKDTAGANDVGKPADVLEYTLTFTNTTGVPISNFAFGDATPASTTFVSVACGSPLPAGITGCTTVAPATGSSGAVGWTFAGTLAPNATVTATLRVKID